MLDLHGRTVLVTGGSKGIGAEIVGALGEAAAERSRAEGASLVPERLEEILAWVSAGVDRPAV